MLGSVPRVALPLPLTVGFGFFVKENSVQRFFLEIEVKTEITDAKPQNPAAHPAVILSNLHPSVNAPPTGLPSVMCICT